jgi:hypothetical protein
MFSFFIGKEKQEKEHKTENKKVIFSLLGNLYLCLVASS